MKIIMDVDTGVDDANAIMLALSDPNAEILAITCVNGNTTLDNVVVNTLRVLKRCKRSDIPVYRGCNRIWMGTMGSPETGFHGRDGLGDTEHDDVDLSLISNEHAANAILRLVNENPAQVTLFACGPLTNIAMALRIDETFGKKLKNCTIMGGNTEARGNFKVAGEFNFACDPEAAMITLNELKCPITLLAMEPCVNHGMPVEWYKQWSNIDTELGRFNRRIIDIIIKNMLARGSDRIAMYDAVAMAVVLNPGLVLEKSKQYCTVECEGQFARGMMVVDWKGHLGKQPNVDIVLKLNVDMLKDMMWKSVDRNV